ncbi:Flp pilus assembly protein CpaB [Halomonas sp. MC140]|nr:Flp pilus assembly protein CpaB [Halomonas sp. MC140]MDN7130812.1 Flp pilus assembly protein CpaB [Halomonas sp. MC140]
MNSRVLMGLAGVLVVAAVVVGYLGLSLGRSSPAPAVSEPAPVDPASPGAGVTAVPSASPEPEAQEPRVDVVVLASSLPAYHTIREEDLQVEQLRLMPPGSFDNPAALVGRMVWRDVPEGSVLNESHFMSGGPVARMIRSDERALAIQFDPLMGVGGHLSPGDYVDVLLFLHEDELNTDRTVQVAVPALRILSVGDALGLATSGEPITPPEPVSVDEQGNQQAAARNQNQPRPETAVLAIPEALLTRFALAADVGNLRLAVRASEEGRLNDFYRGETSTVDELNQQLFQFEKFALSQAERPQPGLVTASARTAPQAPLSSSSQQAQRSGPPAVTVIRGAVSSLETP